MATLETICNMIETMKALYPQYLKNAELRQTATAWAGLFQDIPDEKFIPAFRAAVGRCVFPPTPADINDELRKTAKRDFNPSALWTELVDACNEVNDLRTRFGYTYIPEGHEISQGDQARRDARAVYERLSKPIKDYLGSYSVLLQYAMEMEDQDTIGMGIRRREFEKVLVAATEDADIRELLGLTGEERPLLPE